MACTYWFNSNPIWPVDQIVKTMGLIRILSFRRDNHGTGIEVPIEVEKRMHIYYIRNRGFGNRFNVLGDDNHGTPNGLTQWPRNQEGMWLIQWSFWTVHQTDILWHPKGIMIMHEQQNSLLLICRWTWDYYYKFSTWVKGMS